MDGPSAEHDLVLRARLEGQAPDIDPLVYLTDCDPSALTPGQFVQAEIVASRDYDLARSSIVRGRTCVIGLSVTYAEEYSSGLVPTFFV